jgi:hypothetical protein
MMNIGFPIIIIRPFRRIHPEDLKTNYSYGGPSIGKRELVNRDGFTYDFSVNNPKVTD